MKDFKKFYFVDYMFDVQTLEAKFYYSFDKEVNFEEIISFDDPNFDLRSDIDFEVLENMLFHLHIALGISYYKAYPTADLILESGNLDELQMVFWKKFYLNGLGEFLYSNKISPNGLLNFINSSDRNFTKKDFPLSQKALVPIGGGKDSLVTMSLLDTAGIHYDLHVFGKMDILKSNCAQVAGKQIFLIQRSISKTLFKLNESGYYNGHVPITGIIAFSMLVGAYLFDYRYLVLSNELSANFGNTIWEGVDINHQYSKSLEFEKDFGNYVDTYISSDMRYFSLLRGMYEQKIAELFSQNSQKYFQVFSSCNNNFKIINNSLDISEGGIWCGKCPKCAFVYTLLSAYISKEELFKIFKQDMYADKTLELLFKELMGISGIKPFECVGTNEEVIYSMYLAYTKYQKTTLPYILQIFEKEVFGKLTRDHIKNLENKLLKIYDEDIIPGEMKEKISLFHKKHTGS